MNFFEHQDQARKATLKLTVLFGLTVALICTGVYFASMTAFQGVARNRDAKRGRPVAEWTWWHPQVCAYSIAGTLLVIGTGAAMKIGMLREGGGNVARLLGGRLVQPDTKSASEKRLINVVEEMAIASGVPAPQVYVMDAETGINAFAAGHTPNDAVIGVTRGCLQLLNRDELQGVIAHEFSHILNGDMRLNIRLMGILYGILVLGVIGQAIVRTSFYTGGYSSRSNRDKGGGGIVVLGIALLILGYVGVFFARMIKAAISRQREFLADASAVQFTRNAGGISGALRKIGGYSRRSYVSASEAEEVSHMFFSDALHHWFEGNPLATHPPLEERIQRIDPNFTGDMIRIEDDALNRLREDRTGIEHLSPTAREPAMAGGAMAMAGMAALAGAGVAQGGSARGRASAVVGNMGSISAESVAHSAGVIAALPETVKNAIHEPYGAIVAVYALLMDADEAARQVQIDLLTESVDGGLIHEVPGMVGEIQKIPRESRLPIVDLALPALRQLTQRQYADFKDNVDRLVEADSKVTLFEFSLRTILQHRLEGAFSGGGRAVEHYSFASLMTPIRVLLSALAHSGSSDAEVAHMAFVAGKSRIKNPRAQQVEFLPLAECSLKAVGDALDKLARTTPKIKEQVIDAAAYCVMADDRVTVREAELLRAVAHALECPMPPFLPSV